MIPAAAATAVGRVAALRAYPVKSMDASPVEEVQVLVTGLEHDRGWAVVDEQGEVVTARQAPGLRGVRADVPAGPGHVPVLLLPGAELGVRDTSADVALSQTVGRAVTVKAAAGGGAFTEVAPVHLVSRQAVERAAADEGTTLGDPACSIEEPRANVVLDLGPDIDLETAWVGREVHLGDVVLRISKRPQHCLGVYADVERPGVLRVGDEVRLS